MVEDPGWRPALKGVLMAPLLPLVARRAHQRGEHVDGLITLRTAFLAYTSALVLFGLVVVLVSASEPDTGPAWWVVVPGLVAVPSVVAVAALVRRPLDLAALEASFRQRFLLSIAVAELPALVGFVGAFVAGRPLAYLVGAVGSAVGFALLAPTRARLDREQDELVSRGSTVDLRAALRIPPPGAAPG